MVNVVEYVFPSQPLAYRFLNTVKYFEADKLKVKYGQSNLHVTVSYGLRTGGFDSTLSELDELASQMEGVEV